MEPDGLFVYGTLRMGGANRVWLERTHPEGSCRAWIPGRLFHIPEAGYPALVPGSEPPEAPPGTGWVVGEFLGFGDEVELAQALTDLDTLEDTEGRLFERRVLPCILDSGHRYGAWVYVFPEDRLPALETRAVELVDGDWAPYLWGERDSWRA